MKTITRALAVSLTAGAMAIPAVTPAMAQDRYGWHGDRNHDWRDRDWRDSSRRAIARCTARAENQASRYTRGRANVTAIRAGRETRHGYEVRGRIAVNVRHGGWDGRGWGSDGRYRDTGSFTCRFESGRVVDLDIDGIGRL